jgi:hypothetical protein
MRSVEADFVVELARQKENEAQLLEELFLHLSSVFKAAMMLQPDLSR